MSANTTSPDEAPFAAEFLNAAKQPAAEQPIEARPTPLRIMKLREACGAPSMACKLALIRFNDDEAAIHALFILGATTSKGTSQELSDARAYTVTPAVAMRVRESTGADLVLCKRSVQLHKGDEAESANHLRRLANWVREVELRHAPATNLKGSDSAHPSSTTGHWGEDELLGAHVVTPRFGYTHHGIYVGAGRVVHYSGLADGIEAGPVEEVDLAAFTGGEKLWRLIHESPRFPPLGVVSRARSRIGESLYSVATNNCEHFCHWCIDGMHSSPQVKRVARVLLPFPFNLLSDPIVDWMTT